MSYLYLLFILRSVGRVIDDDDLLCHVYIDRWSVRRGEGGRNKNNATIFLSFRFLELPIPSLVLSHWSLRPEGCV